MEMHVHVYAPVCAMYAHVCIYVCGGQRSASIVLLNGSPPEFLRLGLSLYLELPIQQARLASKARGLLSPPVQCCNCECTPQCPASLCGC